MAAAALVVSFAAAAAGVALAGAVGYVPILLAAAGTALLSQVAIRWFWRSAGEPAAVA